MLIDDVARKTRRPQDVLVFRRGARRMLSFVARVLGLVLFAIGVVALISDGISSIAADKVVIDTAVGKLVAHCPRFRGTRRGAAKAADRRGGMGRMGSGGPRLANARRRRYFRHLSDAGRCSSITAPDEEPCRLYHLRRPYSASMPPGRQPTRAAWRWPPEPKAFGDSSRFAASFEDFIALADTSKGSSPASLVATATHLAGRKPDLIAVDMPMMDAPHPHASGCRQCRQPGLRGSRRRHPFADGPPSRCRRSCPGGGAFRRRLSARKPSISGRLAGIEIYPHPALIELMGAPYRLPYKAGNTGKYWRGEPLAERRLRLFEVWAAIVAALDGVLAGSAAALCLPAACRARPKPQVL